MLDTVALNDLPGAVVLPYGEGQSQHIVAGLDDLRDITHPVLLLLLTLPGLEILYQLVLHDVSTEAKEILHRLEEVEVTLMVSHCLTVVLPGGHWAACRPSSSTDKLTADELRAVGQGQNSSSALPRQHDNYTLN